MESWTREFLDLALAHKALRFGQFTLKSGRVSPYFFNAGAFDHGAGLAALARCYTAAIRATGIRYDMLFGPAYKGIPLAAAVALTLARDFGHNVSFAFNRKEAKDYGEGGNLIGAPLAGRVLIIDDVISAGTSIREACRLIRAHDATPAGVAVGLDRMERGEGDQSASAEIRAAGLDVIVIATLDDLIEWLQASASPPGELSSMQEYRVRYGA